MGNNCAILIDIWITGLRYVQFEMAPQPERYSTRNLHTKCMPIYTRNALVFYCGLVPIYFTFLRCYYFTGIVAFYTFAVVPVKQPWWIWVYWACESMGNLWYNSSKTKLNSHVHIDGLGQERRNSTTLAMELRLFCTNPLYISCNFHTIIVLT